MPRLPTADDLNTLMPTASRRMSAADTSGIGRGLQQMGSTLTGIAVDAMAQARQQDLAADSARSVAFWNEQEIAIEKDQRENPDWDRAPQRTKAAAEAAAKAAAGVIRDPVARERARLQFSARAMGLVDKADATRFAKSRDASRAAVTESLAKTSTLYSDPTTDDTIKDGLLKSADETIQAALGTGLIDEAEAVKMRNAYVMGAKTQLLENLAKSGAPLPELGVGVSSRAPAAIRHNNPGAMWPGRSSRKFGATGEATLNDGQGNKIATFPTPEAGAAAQFDLLASPAYAGMTVTDTIKKWSGGNSSAAYVESLRKAGVDVDGQVATAMREPGTAIALAKAMARVEAGRDFPMSDEQWQAAYGAAFAGGKLPETSGYKQVDQRFADVPYEQRLAAYQISENVQRQAQAAAVAQAESARAQVRDGFGLKIQMDDPAVTQATILGSSILDDGDKTALLKSMEDRQKTTRAANAVFESIQRRERVTLNPYSEDDRKTVDVVYDQLNKATANDPEAPLKNLGLIQNLTGIVPPKAVAQLRGAIVGTATDTAMLAMQVANKMLVNNPNVFAGMPGGDDLAKKAMAFAFNVENLGRSAMDAAKRVRELDDMRAQGRIKVTDEAVKSFQDSIKKTSSLFADAASPFNESWWPGKPAIGTSDAMRQSMLADYAELAGQYYSENYSADEAKAMAARDLKKVWGVSKLQGTAYNGTVMRYAPELKYPPAPDASGKMGHDYLVEQAAAKIKEVAGKDVKAGDIQFLPIPSRTSVAWGNNQPVPYQLQYTYKDKDGYTIHEVLPGVEFVGDPQAAIDAYRGRQKAEVFERRAQNEAFDSDLLAPLSQPAPVRPEDLPGRAPAGRGVTRPMTEQERLSAAQKATGKQQRQYEAMRRKGDEMDAAIERVDGQQETQSPIFTPPLVVRRFLDDLGKPSPRNRPAGTKPKGSR